MSDRTNDSSGDGSDHSDHSHHSEQSEQSGGSAGPIERLSGRLVVSCQAYSGEPLRDPDAMRRMAQAVLAGGAAGIRAQGVADVEAIRAHTDVPLIGLWKDGDHAVQITPTARHAKAIALAGADIVALDATGRERPDGHTYRESFATVHKSGHLVMADVATYEEGVRAAETGADLVGTTLSGYTGDSVRRDGPDLELVARLSAALPVPVVAEGRIHTPEQAAGALDAGAHAVVVGTAITHPTTLTTWFARALPPRG